MASPRMVHLVTVQGGFHGRVVAARLGAEGILAELRGAVDGPYPTIGNVEVWVEADEADDARELLLADEIEAAFDDVERDGVEGALAAADRDAARDRRRRVRIVLVVVAAVVLVSLMATARVV